jgi:hypothetical protein
MLYLSFIKTAKQHEIWCTTCSWVSMMGGRTITETLAGENLEGYATKGSQLRGGGGGLNCLYCGAWFWTRS